MESERTPSPICFIFADNRQCVREFVEIQIKEDMTPSEVFDMVKKEITEGPLNAIVDLPSKEGSNFFISD
jgi:hypothetical protein